MAGNWPGLLNLCLSQGKDTRRVSRIPRGPSRAGNIPLRRFSGAFSAPPVKPALRYAPTYRLEPKTPLNTEVCEKIMKEVMDQAFEDFVYKPKQALIYGAQVAEEIKNRIKLQNYDRYRYICVVSIGEKVMQGFTTWLNFLWDAERDGYLINIYDTPKFFAIANLFYIYYD